jgi:hypothetical protein
MALFPRLAQEHGALPHAGIGRAFGPKLHTLPVWVLRKGKFPVKLDGGKGQTHLSGFKV